jgi:drug/metabolite transporter (DMT)-like permease
MGERPRAYQWLGVLVGLAGVALVVWHKVDVRAISGAALACVLVSLAAITVGTLYQRAFCPTADLRAAALVQFAATLATLLPLAITVEGFEVRPAWALAGAIGFLVVFSSILAVNALHTLMRRGEATRVTSLLYLTPIIAVALEWLLFAVVPTPLTALGVAVTCAGVALVAWRPRLQ